MIGAHVLLALAKEKRTTLALYRRENSIAKIADFFN